MATTVTLVNGFGVTVRSPRGRLLTTELPVPSQRLIAFLAAERRPRARGYVAFSLWPEVGEAQAQQSLRTALWEVQQRLPGLLEAQRTDIGLDREVDVDLHQLNGLARRMPCEQPLRQMERLIEPYSHELLPDWYDDWLLALRERWREVRLHALDDLSERFRDRGAFGPAVDAAVAAVSIEPIRESSRRALIRAYLAEGNHAQAARELRRFETVLRDELEVTPSPELLGLVGRTSAARP